MCGDGAYPITVEGSFDPIRLCRHIDGAQPGVGVCLEGCLDVRSIVWDVGPVDNGGDPGLYRTEQSDEGRRIQMVW